jgi:hypothetical protein
MVNNSILGAQIDTVVGFFLITKILILTDRQLMEACSKKFNQPIFMALLGM